MAMLLDTMANFQELSQGGFGEFHGDILKAMSACPTLADLHKNVLEHPQIAAYLKERPAYPF